MRDIRYRVLMICASIWIALMLLVMFFAYAQAHEAPKGWSYDYRCCSDKDCSQQSKAAVKETKDGYLITATGEVIPYKHPTIIFPSKDEYYHRCENLEHMTRCLYVPDKGF